MDRENGTDFENQLIVFVRRTLRPEAIILYGSRVRGGARPHSDWDVYVVSSLCRVEPWEHKPFLFQGEIVDMTLVPPTIARRAPFWDTFGTTLLYRRVLWERHEVGRKLVRRAHLFYTRTDWLRGAYAQERILFISKMVGRMEDAARDSGVFFIRSAQFYEHAMRCWYELLNERWPLPLHEAERDIRARDPAYYALLRALHVGRVSIRKKVRAAKKIQQLLASA